MDHDASAPPFGSGKPRRSDSTVDIPACSGDESAASSVAASSGSRKPRSTSCCLRAAACFRSARALKAFTLGALCAAIVITALFFSAGAVQTLPKRGGCRRGGCDAALDARIAARRAATRAA
jgi:hypothetical protein